MIRKKGIERQRMGKFLFVHGPEMQVVGMLLHYDTLAGDKHKGPAKACTSHARHAEASKSDTQPEHGRIL